MLASNVIFVKRNFSCSALNTILSACRLLFYRFNPDAPTIKTARRGKYAQYSPYSNGAVDAYMDDALACTDLEASYELWKKAQWDGGTGITQEGDLPWIWLVNIDHLYWVKDGLQVAEQKLHPHGHGWSIINNVDQWTWE